MSNKIWKTQTQCNKIFQEWKDQAWTLPCYCVSSDA